MFFIDWRKVLRFLVKTTIIYGGEIGEQVSDEENIKN